MIKDVDKKIFCIYILIDPRKNSKNKVFYIGKSSSKRIKKRIQEHCHDSRKSKKINKIKSIKKSGFNFEYKIIKENLTEDRAFELEEKLIKILKYLCNFNLTNGNDGGKSGQSGGVRTEDFKQKLSFDRFGSKNPMFGRKKELNPNFGIKISEETRIKIKEKRKSQILGKQKIYIFDKIGRYKKFDSKNNFLKEFNISKSQGNFYLKNHSINNYSIVLEKEMETTYV